MQGVEWAFQHERNSSPGFLPGLSFSGKSVPKTPLIPMYVLQPFPAHAAASEEKHSAEESMRHPFRFAITNGSQFALAQER
jgi:hypothetical protein